MQIWEYLPEEAPVIVVFLMVSVALFRFNWNGRPPTVTSLAYFPVLQCRPIRVLEAKVTAEFFENDRCWAIFTEDNTVAELSLFPFLADIQPLFHYEYSASPSALELRYSSRSFILPLSTPPSDSPLPFSLSGLSALYIPESPQVSHWLYTLFRVPLILGRIVRSKEVCEATEPVMVSTASHLQCEGDCALWQRANIVVEHCDYEAEQLWREVVLGSVVLRRRGKTLGEWMPGGVERRWGPHQGMQCEVVQAGVIHLNDQLKVTKSSEANYWQ